MPTGKVMPRTPRFARVLGLWAFGVVLVLISWGCRRTAPDPGEEPRQSFQTPYRNLGPGVKYVGDRACAGCHADKATTYRHHPMGNSFAPISGVADGQPYATENHNPFEQFGLQFLVEHRDGRVFHRQTLRDARGRAVAAHEDEVAFALGSGSHGYSYLVNRDGYLYQSPVSWFSQKKRWDLSPGFGPGLLAGRGMRAACLFCHCNQAAPVTDTVNRYRAPFFNGYAIGCERCHGPGEQHVRRRERGEVVKGLDDTIVDPGRLPHALREAVCQQCHLQGLVRLLRRNRGPFDYRPGLPLHDYWAVFVPSPELGGSSKAVSQVEQMYDSRCFRASDGKLGCISCHDPHVWPAPEQRVAYYRDRCLKCHQDKGCSLPLADRRKVSKQDSCIVCHMARFQSADIAHTAVTDHRILRAQEKAVPAAPRWLQPWESPLVNFHQELLDPKDDGTTRDLGVALSTFAGENPNLRKHSASLAVPLLENALEATPDDVPAWEAKSQALWLQGQGKEALAAVKTALAKAPKRESALESAAVKAAELGQTDEAITYWRRILAVNPHPASYHARLAKLLGQRGDWRKALAECQVVLRDNLIDVDTRVLLVTCCLRTGDKARARTEFNVLLALKPPNEQELRRWFADETR
jgi:predicted CXXCH cytochrome family protein